MPFSESDAPADGRDKAKWSKIANGVYESCREKHPDRDEKECAAVAKIVANSQTGKGESKERRHNRRNAKAGRMSLREKIHRQYSR